MLVLISFACICCRGGVKMNEDKEVYEKIQKVLEVIEEEVKRPLDNYSYETRLVSKGYRKGLLAVKKLIWSIFN